MERPRLFWSPQDELRKNPELAKSPEFWRKINPKKFLEEDPQSALRAVRSALQEGIKHTAINDILRTAVRTQDFETVAKMVGAHENDVVAKYLLDFYDMSDIHDRELAERFTKVADATSLVDILGHTRDIAKVEELMERHRKRILSDPKIVKKLAQYPDLLRLALEHEWHAEMDEKQIKAISNQISRTAPGKMLQIITGVLKKDIKTPKGAENTVKILRYLLRSAANHPESADNMVEIYKKIKGHVFPAEGGKRTEFGKKFLAMAGEDMAFTLINAAMQKMRQGRYDEAGKLYKEATWLMKEFMKHMRPEHVERFAEDPRTRYVKIGQTMLKMSDPKVLWTLDPAARKEAKLQMARMIDYGINAGLLEKLPSQHIQRIATNLADARMRDAILPVAKTLAKKELPKTHKLAMMFRTYLGAHESAAPHEFAEILEKLSEEEKISDGEVKRLANAVGVNTLLPKALWKQMIQNG